MQNCEKPYYKYITPVLQDFADFVSVSLVFNMFLTLMLVEVNGI